MITAGCRARVPRGNLPKGWTRRRLRFDVHLNPTKSALDMEPDELVSFIPMDAVGEYGGLDLDDVRRLQDVYDGYTYFADGDLCIAKITPSFENGKGALAERLTNGVGFGTTELHVVRPGSSIDRCFLFYVTIADDFRKLGESEMYGTAGQKRIDESFIKDWVAPLPPLDTQRRIAQFLDEKTARIDGMIEKKRDLLDRLAEKRQALITRTVTKGLNPDAGGMTKVPDRVREAYRELPSGWKVEKLKFFANIRNSNVDKTVSEDEKPVRLCNYTDVYYHDRITADLDFIQGSATEAEIERFQLKSGQVIITKDSEAWDDIGIPAFVTEDMPDVLCGYHLSVFEPGQELDGSFLAWLCRAEPLNDQFKLAVNGVTRYGLGQYPMKNALIALPPLETQRQIARFLDEKTGRIDAIANQIRCSMEYLREYRSALITATVTGQLAGLR